MHETFFLTVMFAALALSGAVPASEKHAKFCAAPAAITIFQQC